MPNVLSFKQIISPIHPRQFFSEYWEKKPLLIQRNSKFYKSLLSLNDIEYLLFSLTSPHSPWVRFTNAGYEEDIQNYVVKRKTNSILDQTMLNREEVLNGFKNGNSIILHLLNYRWEPIKKLSFDLENLVGGFVVAGAYLTPKNARAAFAHRDAEEVFILQIEGNKRWKVYDYPYDTTDRGFVLGHKKKPVIEVVLKPGDLLYIPRGCVHEAITVDSYSLHLSLGVINFTWSDLIKEAAEKKSEFRRFLPRNALTVENYTIKDDEIYTLLKSINPSLFNKSLKKFKDEFLKNRFALFHDGFYKILKNEK